MKPLTVREALLTVLDQVDYTNGACGVTEMVGAVLPKNVIALAREALAKDKSDAVNPDPLGEALNSGDGVYRP